MGLIPHLYHGEYSGEVWLNGYRNSEEDEIIFGLENLGLAHDEITARLETALMDFNLGHMRHAIHRLIRQ